MHQVVALLFTKAVLMILAAAALIGVVTSRLRRRLRISPDQPTRAPISWLAAPRSDARLHRRLRKAARQVRSAATGGKLHRGLTTLSPAQRLARDVETELVIIDERLVGTVEFAPEVQQRRILDLQDETIQIEEIIRRLSKALRAEADNPAISVSASGIPELSARLDRMESSHSRSELIDTQATTVSSGPLPRLRNAIGTSATENRPEE